MDMSGITSRQGVIEAFENLFQIYGNIGSEQLPKFKKRAHNISSSSSTSNQADKKVEKLSLSGQHRKGAHLSRSQNERENCHGKAIASSDTVLGEGSQLGSANHQGSFSSGVFSIDSDVDIAQEDEDFENAGSKDGFDVATCHSSESPKRCAERSEGNTKDEIDSSGRHQEEKASTSKVEGRTESEAPPHQLTDVDVLFMMHKPRLRKRRKKPPWQKRKLDIDDIWVNGQHRWGHHFGEDVEVSSQVLFLNRNLRLGKLSLQHYICAMRKSRKGKKRQSVDSNASKSFCSKKAKTAPFTDRKSNSLSGFTKEKKCDAKKDLKLTPSTETKVGSGKKQQKTKTKIPKSRTSSKNTRTSALTDSSSEQSSQDFVQQKETKKSKSTGYRNGGKQNGLSNRRDRDRRMSNDEISTYLELSEGSVTSSQKSGKSKKEKGNTGNVRSGASSGKSGSVAIFQDSSENDSSSGGEESYIDFVSFTPSKKSRKLSRRKRLERRRSEALGGETESTDAEVPSRRLRMLHGGATALTSGLCEDVDDFGDLDCPPLFGRGRHCGGLWNCIVEESS